MSRESMVDALGWWADLLDSRFRVPGTSIRFGLDPILSLLPGLGDLASPAFTIVLLVTGVRLRLPRIVILRMALNAFVDALLGVVPLAGNIADIFWRANVANLALLERHARPGLPPARGDYVFVYSVAAVLVVLLALPFVLAIWVLSTIWPG